MNPVDKSDACDGIGWRQWLERRLKSRVSLTWTDNRPSMISVTRHPASGYRLRLHHMFQVAPACVWQALADYARNQNAAAKQLLQAYIHQQQSLIRHPPDSQPSVPVLQARGRYVDLNAIYQHLNRQYFNHQVQADITWMRMSLQRKRTSIRFGVYDRQQKLIRIHRLLDQSFVPHYFVESVVFHEMLHQLIPAIRIHGRWYNHPPAFKQAERQYPYYQEAQKWERENLHRLLG
ncbi:SprT-like domain-containing protein [Candidatus Entotheonella palauensis]|uniref:SprT-like domain-containing protein n=1 Tax=Candidatus Entotheonella gemina TaxID=1429439 RepID=W4MCB7_9BACT|nr:SprT-like domain-containing protein [Candidatus Entotheonella palauensis]ETX07848.1 MAG: hypothetical protein ETSY2_08815 [Candidatus Entotheonella gemina]